MMNRVFPSLLLLLVACSGSSESGLFGEGSSGTSGGTSGGGTSGGTSGGGGTSGSGTSGTIPDAGGADAEGGTTLPPTPCTWSANANTCGPGQYCSTKPNQNGCAMGVCAPIPAMETNTKAPVCGCDGITYWNESVAAKHGMSIRRAVGECPIGVGPTPGPGSAVQCDTPIMGPCRPGASCNHRVANKGQCQNDITRPNTCWQLPAQCPLSLPAPQLTSRACESLTCTDECNLIKLQTKWYEDSCP